MITRLVLRALPFVLLQCSGSTHGDLLRYIKCVGLVPVGDP